MINSVINRGGKPPKKSACILYHNKLEIKLKRSVSESEVLLFVSRMALDQTFGLSA